MRKLVLAGVVLLCMLTMAVPVAASQVQGHISPVTTSYFGVDITTGSPDLPKADGYVGWCVDHNYYIYWNTQYTFNILSSLDEPNVGVPVNWHYINWILNHKGSYSVETIQEALWHFDGSPIYGNNLLVKAALADPGAATFVPTCGQVYALILNAVEGPCVDPVQMIIIERPVPCIPTPEFPTVAVPAGMLLGVGYAVVAVKSRKTEEN